MVEMTHIDTCLSSFLHDHHNRDGECLFGVYVDGNSTYRTVKRDLIDEVRMTGDRVPEAVTDAQIAAAIDLMLPEGDNLDEQFDAMLEVIDEEEAETMGGDEMPQAWFLLTWDAEESD